MMNPVQVGVSLMVEPDFAQTILPLLEQGLVDVVEWSFDVGWSERGIPEWLDQLLAGYADAGGLSGHGVSFSSLSSHPGQQRWLECFEGKLQRRNYRRISEHLALLAVGPFARSAPLPLPHVPEVVEVAFQPSPYGLSGGIMTSPLDDFSAHMVAVFEASGKTGGDFTAVRECALAGTDSQRIADWIAGWDDDMTALAVELVDTWAQRDASS